MNVRELIETLQALPEEEKLLDVGLDCDNCDTWRKASIANKDITWPHDLDNPCPEAENEEEDLELLHSGRCNHPEYMFFIL